MQYMTYLTRGALNADSIIASLPMTDKLRNMSPNILRCRELIAVFTTANSAPAPRRVNVLIFFIYLFRKKTSIRYIICIAF